MRDVPVRVRWFVWGTVLFGSALLAMTLWHAEWAWLHVMALAMAVGLSFMRVDLRRYDSKHKVLINLDIAITFFMMAMFGPAWAMLTLVFSTIVTGITARTQVYKIAFNIGTLMISSWISAELVYRAHLPFPWGLVLAATGYFLVNTTCITLVISMLGGRNPLTVWRESYAWLAAQHLTLAVAGFALGKLVASVGWWALLGALPLPMLHYTLWLNARSNERHIQQQEALSSELITTLAAVVELESRGAPIIEGVYTWAAIGGVEFEIAFYFDRLTAVMAASSKLPPGKSRWRATPGSPPLHSRGGTARG